MWVFLGGGLGAVMRFACSVWVGPTLFPWATLGTNIGGSFLIGLIWAGCADLEWFQNWGRQFLVIGILGGFTTFSAFSLETLQLVNDARIIPALGYALGSIGVCFAAVYIGYRLG